MPFLFLCVAGCLLQRASSFTVFDRSTPANASRMVLQDICNNDVLPKNREENYFWASKNGDMRMTGASSSTAPSNLTGGPEWSFKFQEGTGNSFHPCIDDRKNIYVVSRNGDFHKFNRNGGKKWSVNVPKVVGACALMDGVVYVGTSEGTVVALNMGTGRQRWATRYAGAAPSDSWSLAAHSGVIIAVGAEKQGRGTGSRVYALDDAGTVLWNRTLGNLYNFIASFAERPPSIIASDSGGHAVRVRLCDGETLWTSQKLSHYRATEWVTSGGSIAPGNGLVYVTSNVRAHDIKTGQPRPPGAGGTFKPGDIRGVVVAYNETTGGFVWKQEFELPTSSAPALGNVGPKREAMLVVGLGDKPSHPDEAAEENGTWADGTPVYFRSQVLALDPLTGDRTSWGFTPPPWMHTGGAGDNKTNDCYQDAVSNAAIGADGAVYFGHMDGRIYVLKDSDGNGRIGGSEVSSWEGRRVDQGSPGLAPGMLVYSPCDGIHVFKEHAK